MQVFEIDAAIIVVNRVTNDISAFTDTLSPARLHEGKPSDIPVFRIVQGAKPHEAVVIRANLSVEVLDV